MSNKPEIWQSGPGAILAPMYNDLSTMPQTTQYLGAEVAQAQTDIKAVATDLTKNGYSQVADKLLGALIDLTDVINAGTTPTASAQPARPAMTSSRTFNPKLTPNS